MKKECPALGHSSFIIRKYFRSEIVIRNAEEFLEFIRIVSCIHGCSSCDEAEIYESLEVAVESMHSLESGRLESVGDHLDLIFKDEALDGACSYHDLCCKYTAIAVRCRQELL